MQEANWELGRQAAGMAALCRRHGNPQPVETLVFNQLSEHVASCICRARLDLEGILRLPIP